jgi:hypothetical protein
MNAQPIFRIVESKGLFYIVADCRAISVGLATIHDANNAMALASAAYMIGADVALDQFSKTLRDARIAS